MEILWIMKKLNRLIIPAVAYISQTTIAHQSGAMLMGMQRTLQKDCFGRKHLLSLKNIYPPSQ